MKHLQHPESAENRKGGNVVYLLFFQLSRSHIPSKPPQKLSVVNKGFIMCMFSDIAYRENVFSETKPSPYLYLIDSEIIKKSQLRIIFLQEEDGRWSCSKEEGDV